MTFSVTILGSNSAIPTLHRNPSAHLLNANERLFLIDCAEGTQLQLRRYKIKFQRISRIFISHLHGDHYFGVPGLINTLHLLGRTSELHVHAHAELEGILDAMLSASKTRLSYPLMFHPLSDSGKEVICDSERLRVFSFPLKHSIPACGFLFTEKHASTVRARKERSYAYCSDTAYSREIAGYVKGADLLYHEATFLHEMETTAHEKMHSTALEAGMLAKEAGAVRLVIGHFSARYDDPEPLLREALTVFPDTVLAEDGKKIDICTQ